MLPIVLPEAAIITTAGDDKLVAANALDTLLNAPAQPPPQGIVPGYAHGEKNADEDFAATVAYRKTGVRVAVGQSFEQAALRYMLTLDLKYPECPNAANGYVSFRQWCVNAAALAIDNMAQDAPADGFGVHCYNKGMAVALPIKLGWVDRCAIVERAFAIIERAGRNSPENAKNSFRNGLGERVRSHNVLLQAIDKITREAAATSVTDERTAALAQNGFQTEMVASNCPGDMMEVALWHVAENREASNAEYDAMTAAGLWQPHGAGGVDANLWAQKMPLGGVGFGAAAVTSFDAEGLIDVPKLPEFQSCPALAELVREAPTYGLDPTAAVSYAVGIIANLAGERFDVRKPKAPASVSVHLPMPVVVLNASGAGKSTLHDTVALGALFILRSRNAAVQLAAARFEHEYKAYVAACKKSNTHPKECKMLKPVRLFEGANVTPQAWQQILCANQPSTLCISDEVGTFFENGKGNMKNAMSDVLVMMYDGKAIKPYRVGNAQAQGKIVAQGAFETEARGIGRASLVGLTQLRKWKEEILGNGELRYLTNSGALARLFIVPAMTKLSIGERDRNTLVPGTGTDSPFKMWEACVTAFAWRCYAFIDRISEYGREVGEFRIAPVMRELTMPWGGTVWDIEPMPVQVPNGCIDADAPPKVPPKVMLGGDAQRFLSLRLTETGNAWLVEQRASFSDLADTGAFGSGVQDLETINARLLDNVLRVAAAIHCINEANELLALDWFKEEDRGAGPLEIPDIVLKDAWDFVQHALLASLSKGCYGHRIAGKKTKFEARSEDLNSPTEASTVAAAAAGVEGILLRRLAKLGSATPGDVQRQLSKKQQRDHFPDAAATRAALDRLAAAGRIVKSGEEKGATYALAGNKPSNEEDRRWSPQVGSNSRGCGFVAFGRSAIRLPL